MKKAKKLTDFKRGDITLYRSKVKEARLSATTIPDFFDRYSQILYDVFKVTMKFTDYPDHIIDQNSSHNSPIGKPGAWTQEQKDDPNIPNTYKCYVGKICGELIQNDGEYASDKFEGYDMFWTFSDIALDFANGTPNGGSGRGEGPFDIELKLFLEDFPLVYRGYRNEDKIAQANEGLETAINQYKNQTSDIHNKMVSEDEVINSINKQIDAIDVLRRELQDQKVSQVKALGTKAKKAGLPLPKIENNYLDLKNYNTLRRESEAPIEMVQDDAMDLVYKKVSKVIETFDTYKDEFACDFL